ncbi:MAG TPA: hypothetical protein VHK69_12890 [Chitinophagaceae bacterium]|jgi:hypothetical protein|nr:hypothetical protein [Chitinophagaceae bacterium]
MKAPLYILLLLLLCSPARSQGHKKTPLQEKRLSCTFSFDARTYAFPFPTGKALFSARGFSLGAGFNWKRNAALRQQFTAGVHYAGRQGIARQLATALQYYPVRQPGWKAGLSIGAGYQVLTSGTTGWQQEEGAWNPRRNRAGHFFLPAGIHLQVKAYESRTLILAPSLSCQVQALYRFVPNQLLVPQTVLSIGTHLTIK